MLKIASAGFWQLKLQYVTALLMTESCCVAHDILKAAAAAAQELQMSVVNLSLSDSQIIK